MTDRVDRWWLYERTVQDPRACAAFLRALHGGDPRVLGEDFCGSAALSRAWVEAVEGGRAIAVDVDREALARAGSDPRIEVVAGDVRRAIDPARHRADVVFAGNFSAGELPTRADLVAWLGTARARLAPGGICAVDTYAGAAAWRTGARERSRWLADGTRVRWLWEQRAADPATARVVDALHFRVERAGEVVVDLPDAFVYRWRLWSPPELADALREAGFAAVEVAGELAPESAAGGGHGTAPREPRASEDELYVACVVGRAPRPSRELDGRTGEP